MRNKIFTAGLILLIALPTQFCGCGPQSSVNSSAPEEKNDALEEQAGRIIKEALAGSDPRIRANAIEAVSGLPLKQAGIFMPDVQKLLADEFVPVRFVAAVAVGDMRYVPAKNAVMELLKDKDQNVRLAAAYAVGKLAPGTSVELIGRDLSSRDLRVRANAAMLLGKIGDKKTIPLLYEAMRDESSDDRVRLNSIEAIARLGDERIYQKIWALLISAYADDRVLGVRAMGALATGQAKDAIITMLDDDLVEVRLIAAEQLGNLGDQAGENVVIEALTQGTAGGADRDTKERIETLAALAIGQIKTRGLKKFLPELLKSESQFVKIAAAKAVFLIGGDDNIGR
ncbi:MAG: HEAT repeat domain-containing protein [Sedimentisphaerales bacterium]|nr:HEAT repeat domain-containing protein [Sedimentisphaerales bacterium]